MAEGGSAISGGIREIWRPERTSFIQDNSGMEAFRNPGTEVSFGFDNTTGTERTGLGNRVNVQGLRGG